MLDYYILYNIEIEPCSMLIVLEIALHKSLNNRFHLPCTAYTPLVNDSNSEFAALMQVHIQRMVNVDGGGVWYVQMLNGQMLIDYISFRLQLFPGCKIPFN